MSYILAFLKFGSEEHSKDLIQNGTIFMNSIEYFRRVEDNQLRGDKYEGVTEIINSLPGEFEISALGYRGNHQGIHLRKAYDVTWGNIYSLFCISSHGWKKPDDFCIDPKMKEFGSHCVLIKDNTSFLNLISDKLNEAGVKFHHGFVEYYDRNLVNRRITLFEKPLEFEYQKEFRFYIERDFSDSFKINIGNIEHIAELAKTEDILNSLKLVQGLPRKNAI